MKYTFTTKTVTVETTQPGETVNEVVKALTGGKHASWDEVRTEALRLTAQPQTVEIDTSHDPLEGLIYTDVSPEVLAGEAQADLANMVPANIMAAE